MTIASSDISPLDVVIADVYLEDKPDVSKPRPVVVLEVDDDLLVVVGLKVTSHPPRPWVAGEVVLQDWKEEGLMKPSVARCSKKVALTLPDIKLRCGSLSGRDRMAVLSSIF